MTAYRLTKQALSDLRAISRYTAREWGATQRNHYIRKLEKAMRQVAANPMLGKSAEEYIIQMRYYHVEHHVLYYLIGNDAVYITNILHEKMDPDLHLHPKL